MTFSAGTDLKLVESSLQIRRLGEWT